jgi:hypothetical protein
VPKAPAKPSAPLVFDPDDLFLNKPRVPSRP